MAVEDLAGVAWIDANWMFIGLPLCFSMIFRLSHLSWTSMTFLSWALAPLYALHQFEEHGYDYLGRRYSFMAYFNSMTSKSMGIELNPREITIINVILIWFGFPLAGYIAEKQNNLLPAALCWGVATLNAIVAHILPMFLKGMYNPGAFQSLFMAPIGLYFLRETSRIHGPLAVAVALIHGGVIAHAACMLLPLALIHRGVIPADAFILCTLAGAVLPAAAAGHLRRLCPPRSSGASQRRVA